MFYKFLCAFLVFMILVGCQSTQDQEEIPKDQPEVVMDGRISDMPWQHMIDIPETHPHMYYFDTEDGDQFVIYSKTQIDCEEGFKIYGSYIVIEGESKRPDSDEKYTEQQILVEDFECEKVAIL